MNDPELPAYFIWETRPLGPHRIKRFDAAALRAFVNECQEFWYRLTERERGVLAIRARGGYLREAGAAYGVSRERARQIENKAIRKLKYYRARAETARRAAE